MDVLTDDHEREQAVRKWWSENWKSIALGVVIALGGLLGYRQYQSYTLEKAQQQAYELYQLQTALALKAADAVERARAFIGGHEDIYGALMALDLAAAQLASGEYREAADNARFACEHGGELIAPGAALLEARVRAELKDYAGARSVLSALTSEAYAVERAELEGDICLAQGAGDQARESYRRALELTAARRLPVSPLLQMKHDSVIAAGDKPAYQVAEELSRELAAAGAAPL